MKYQKIEIWRMLLPKTKFFSHPPDTYPPYVPAVPSFPSLSLPTAPHHGRKKIVAAKKTPATVHPWSSVAVQPPPPPPLGAALPPPVRPTSREGNDMEGPAGGKGEHRSRLLRPGRRELAGEAGDTDPLRRPEPGGGSAHARQLGSELTPRTSRRAAPPRPERLAAPDTSHARCWRGEAGQRTEPAAEEMGVAAATEEPGRRRRRCAAVGAEAIGDPQAQVLHWRGRENGWIRRRGRVSQAG
jgi:hypothetical protein